MIDIQSLTFNRGDHTILRDFSAQFHTHEATLITGQNGCGKTTLLQIIGGILKPTAGTITINAQNISKMKTKAQAELRSIAPQRRIFELAFTVEQILNIIPESGRAKHTHTVLEHLNIHELNGQKVTELSLGQQQRVSIALALIQNADFYLLDEPLSAQDSTNQKHTLDLLNEIKKEKGVVVISHITENIHSYFDQELSLITL